LVDIWANLGKTWADLIRFGHNQNLAFPKKLITVDLGTIKILHSQKIDLYGYAKMSFIPRQYSWDDRHEDEHRK